MKNLTIFGRPIIDDKCVAQIELCIGDQDIGVLTADAHYGYAHPIGGAVAYKNHVSVSGVGFDIGCGNKAVRTNIMAADIDVASTMDEIFRRISFGTGRINDEPIDHPVIDKILNASFRPQRAMADLAARQLGTVGSGNHYIDLFADGQGRLWIGNHFGSRGFGHKTASGFIAMSQGLGFTDRGKQGSMDSPPILLELTSAIGQDYLEAMSLAGEYAYAGRDVVVNKVLEIIGGRSEFEVHNHHNFAWMETHFGEEYCVVRKGCTPAFPDQHGFVGSNMLDTSVIIAGVDGPSARRGLYSTVHGAGRTMSRTEAAGKKKWVKGKPTMISKGKVDFDEVKSYMKSAGVELRGAGADEAPACYKSLKEVLGYQAESVSVVQVLRPIGVAMAGSETYDPYKD